jgi:hypothetical protein
MILKPKAHIVWRRSRGPRQVRAALAAEAADSGARFGLADRNRERPVSETRVTFLGAITVDPDKTIAFDIPPDADADAIRAALAAAEEERAAAQAREAKRLREIFLEDERR